MRSFTNKLGEVVEVSKEHLDTAVKIKKELQKASPSFRCNWRKLKKLMEEEGFPEAEASEAYRCMIKSYQSSIGELDSKEKYADLVTTSKLQSIKDAIGEINYANQEVRVELTDLRKLKKELTLYGVVAEQAYRALVEELSIEIPSWSLKGRVLSSGKRMVLFLSDWHIGATILNVNGNSYNYEIAKNRVQLLLKKVNEIAVRENVTDIDVVCLGDMTEHISMRKINQAFETEFPMMVQVTKAFELIRDLLINLTKSYNVTFTGISGNHDRANGNKEDNIDGDSTIFLINYLVRTLVETSSVPRLSYIESDNINYSTRLTINGIEIKSVHGDNEKGNRILASHTALDGVVYNLIAMGHIHHYDVTEVGQNQFEAYFGSLMGNNNYGKKSKYSSNASQGLVLIDEYGSLDIRRIDVQI